MMEIIEKSRPILLRSDFKLKLDQILGSTFSVYAEYATVLRFENQLVVGNSFSLFIEDLDEDTILKVAGILEKAYSKVDRSLYRFDKFDGTSLNRPGNLSAELVKEIVNLDRSALHRLLLLTSAHRALIDDDLEIRRELSRAKAENTFTINEIVEDEYLFNVLAKSYFLPGISVETFTSTSTSQNFDLGTISLERYARLMAFITNRSSDLTLEQHLAMSLESSVVTQKTLTQFDSPRKIEAILNSRHKNLILAMDADSAISLSLILDNSMSMRLAPGNLMCDGNFPESILLNRTKAMEVEVQPIGRYSNDSIVRYLSKIEQKIYDDEDLIKDFDYCLKSKNRSVKYKAPPIIYAAFAEVLVRKGKDRALEVARSLEHLRLWTDPSQEFYVAIVDLISEVLKPESDDYPFAWIAQFSDSSWALR